MPMSLPLRRLRRRLATLLAPDAAERALDDELRFHLEMEVDHNVRLGLPPDEARRKAERELGDPAQWHRDDGTVGRAGLLDDLAREVRLAARALRRAPAFTAVAVATLALGIGVSTAVFSVVDGVLLRPLPYPQPERLVRLYERSAERDRISFPGADFRDVRASARTLRHVAFVRPSEATVLGADEPVRARVAWSSREFFDVLGARPALGRTARDAEGTPGGPHVAVVSHGFWQRALGADPDVTRRTLRIGTESYAVVGVMPPEVQYPSRSEVWITATDTNPHRTAHNWAVIGRLAPGATERAAQTEVDGILRRLKAQYGEAMTAEGATVVGLHRDMARNARTTLLVLLGAVGFVLLVACVNLASANLARGETRQQEFAVRTALGAGRGRIVRQVLTENLLLAVGGGALGVALAWALTRLLVAATPAALPTYAVVAVNGRVLAFAAAAAVLAGLLVGLAPAWQVTRDLRGAIARGGRSGIEGARLRARGVLIAAEVALALSLLAGAGLLVRSLDRLLGEELGFEPARVLTADVSLPTSIYSDTARIAGFFHRLLPELRAMPGVQAAGLTSAVPLGGNGGNSSFAVDGGTEWVGSADYRVADSSYFRAMGIPLVLGRNFAATDVPGAEHVLLVSESAARQFWPGVSPLGRRVRFPGMDDHAELWLTVVGVVGDVRGNSPAAPPAPAMYVFYAQRPEVLRGGAAVVVRGTGSADALAAAVRGRVQALDANVPVRLASMEEVVARATADRRFSTVVLSAFAALAVGLAALGIHGVLAYTVAQREREIGVRMALGARRGTVRAMVLRDAMRAVLPGVVLGVAGGLALSRLLRGMLYGVSAADPATFAAVAALLTGVALLAAWLPARRATRVDPMAAIRAEG